MIEEDRPTAGSVDEKVTPLVAEDKKHTPKTISKRKLIIIGVSCLVGLIIIAVVVRAITKSENSNNQSENSQSQQSQRDSALDTALLPFKNSISNGALYAEIADQNYSVEFTSWGAHSAPHAGGHVEGNNKSNFRVHITPSGKTVNMNTGSSTCDATTDLCGVTAADAKANTLWYTAENKGMKLIAIEHQTSQNVSPYIPGEGTQWRLYFSFDGGLDLNLQHTGEISPELLQLINDSGQDSVLNTTNYTKLNNPVPVPLGTRLARPQIINAQSKEINGKTYYQADAQTEWSITPTVQTSKDQTCQWKYFSSDLQKQMQTVMDNELTHPQANGLFSGSSTSGVVGVEGAAEGSLCASDTIAYNNYTKISSNNSFGFYQVNDANKASGETMAVYPISKTSAAYKANETAYLSSTTDFMFRRGPDISGFSDISNFSFSLMQGSKAYIMHDLSGEIIDMSTASDNTKNDHFTVRIDRGDLGAMSEKMPIGEFVGVRYKIEKDRVVMQYSELADSASAVKIPGIIPDAASCDGVYLCYIHDFSLLKQ